MKKNSIFRGRHSPSLKREFLYGRIARIEYDRAAKTLRVSSGGLRPASMEIVMFYENSDVIIKEIEKRSGVFAHPAMRGDDYADLKDLPGLRRERSLLRPMSAAVLAFCLASLMTALWIRTYNHNNPYLPFPRTLEMYVVGRFAPGDTAVLDGCEITLNGVTRAGSDSRGVCYQFLVTLRNENDSPIRLRGREMYKGSAGNVLFTAVYADGRIVPLETTPPPPGYIGVSLAPPQRIPAGKNVSVTYFVWADEDVESIELTINSDYWPPADRLRDVTYTGGFVDIGGVSYKSNETRFVVNLAALE
jgi:hypothetical protein